MKAILRKEPEILLAYGLSEEEESFIKSKCTASGIKYKRVNYEERDLKVNELLKRDEEIKGGEFKSNGKYALMAGLRGNRRKECSEIVGSASKDIIKATVTPYNIGWKFSELCTELEKEEEYMLKKQNGD